MNLNVDGWPPIHGFIFHLVFLLLGRGPHFSQGHSRRRQNLPAAPVAPPGLSRRLVHLSAVGLGSGAQTRYHVQTLECAAPAGELRVSEPHQSPSWPPPSAPASPSLHTKASESLSKQLPPPSAFSPKRTRKDPGPSLIRILPAYITVKSY